VKFKDESNLVPCVLNQARVKTCKEWAAVKTLGSCDLESGKSIATRCHRAFTYDPAFTIKNAEVLCMQKVARREVEITHADTVTASGYEKPAFVLTGKHGKITRNPSPICSLIFQYSKVYRPL